MTNCAAKPFVRRRPLCIALHKCQITRVGGAIDPICCQKKNAVLEGQVRDTKPAAKDCC
jgi:hypothetical protein